MSNYGAVYAIQQMSVSIAYSVGPMIGGESAQYIGFGWLMIIVGSINILYAIILFICILKSSLVVSVPSYICKQCTLPTI